MTIKLFRLLWALLGLMTEPAQEPGRPARMPPPIAQAPGKQLPGLAIPAVSPRERATFETVQGLRAEMNKRLAPDSVYMRENPNANPNLLREMMNRAIFETMSVSHGDKGVVIAAVTQLKASDHPRINLLLVDADLKWIVREKSRWLDSAIDRLAAGRAAAGADVQLKAEPIPPSFFITTGSGRHPAYKDLTSRDLPGLREEARYLRGNASGFDLSARFVADALRDGLENPAESELSRRFKAGRTLDPKFFYARLWQATFLNLEKFHGDRALLAEALDLLAQDVPEVATAKDPILNDLGSIKRERIRWFDDFVLPAVSELERVGMRGVVASPQMAPIAEVQMPRIAWILAEPGPENVPRRPYSGYPLLKTTNEMLRSLP